MIYLENVTTQQSCRIPSNGLTPASGSLQFILASTIGGAAVYTATIAVASLTEEKGYYTIPVTLPDGTRAGEYAYTLRIVDGSTIASGLAQVGEYTRKMSEGAASFELKQAK